MDNKVKAPAIALMISAGLSLLLAVLSLLLNVLGAGIGAVGDEAGQFVSGAMGIGFAAIGIVWQGVIIFGALKMKNLENYTLAMVAAVMALIPLCPFCCSIINLPFGIWALVVLLTGETRSLFPS